MQFTHPDYLSSVTFSCICRRSVDNFFAVGEMRHLSLSIHVRAGYSGSLHISSSLRINYIMFQRLHFIPEANSTITWLVFLYSVSRCSRSCLSSLRNTVSCRLAPNLVSRKVLVILDAEMLLPLNKR